MAEVNHQRIKGVYGEIFGILSQLAPVEKGNYSPSIAQNYNSIVDELSTLTDADYSRHKLTDADKWDLSENYYDSQSVRAKIGSLVSRLEQEYGFGQKYEHSPSPILNITNMNHMKVTIVSIDQLMNDVDDEDIKVLLLEIKTAIEQKDIEKSKGLLKTLLDKSWELFLRVLPWILQQWSKNG